MKTLLDRINEGQDLSRAVKNINQSYERRSSRLKKRIETMINDYEWTYFITFTIAPAFENLKYNTYLRKIKEALVNASHWVLNADYGAKHDRLHYHALVSYTEQLDYNILNEIYKYGAINIIKIYNTNEKGIREYMSKQYSHITKQTAGKIHYSR